MAGPSSRPPLVVVMGVTGAGKSTVGSHLARRLQVPYADADNFHSDHAIRKMNSGVPLGDADRVPWLVALGTWLEHNESVGGVIACSALKRQYRDTLREYTRYDIFFLHLAGSRDVVLKRVASRPGHFMPVSLVDSQYQQLEPLEADEYGITVDLQNPLEVTVASFMESVSELGTEVTAPE